jgi:hypothetical protein
MINILIRLFTCTGGLPKLPEVLRVRPAIGLAVELRVDYTGQLYPVYDAAEAETSSRIQLPLKTSQLASGLSVAVASRLWRRARPAVVTAEAAGSDAAWRRRTEYTNATAAQRQQHHEESEGKAKQSPLYATPLNGSSNNEATSAVSNPPPSAAAARNLACANCHEATEISRDKRKFAGEGKIVRAAADRIWSSREGLELVVCSVGMAWNLWIPRNRSIRCLRRASLCCTPAT